MVRVKRRQFTQFVVKVIRCPQRKLRTTFPPTQYGLWLDPRCQDMEKLAKLLRPYPSNDMMAYRVSTVVNDPKHDVPQCVEAIW
jgi:putative SOS response-associated peptidase YedK